MCLAVKQIRHSYKCETIEGEKLIPVWKILTRDNQSPMYPMHNGFHWESGWNVSSIANLQESAQDRLPIKPKKEKPHIFVTEGLHFFLNKKDAFHNQWRRYLKSGELKLVKMYVRKNDIIAKGTCTSDEIPSLTAFRAYWKGE